MRQRQAQAGFTLAELAFGLLVFVIVAVVLINHLSVNYSATRTQKERVFAFTKAQAILSEIQAFVDRGEITAAIDLDSLDDGVVNKPTLSITESGGSLVSPDHPLSGNIQRDGAWMWSRRITVQPFSGLNNRNVRYVTVRIYKRNRDGNENPMASLSSVVNSVGSSYPTTQVFDVYLLAIENIPGWWVYMDAIRPFLESVITDLESRNPGFKVRTHWITKASYGRNKGYRPNINVELDSLQDQESVYYYPGLMPSGSASSYYYVPDLIKARVSFDGVLAHGFDADRNPYPYALADWFNTGMRLPQERAFHDRRVAAIKARRLEIEAAKRASTTPPEAYEDMSEEPTLRLLLEDMNMDPDKYRHALVINCHGELLPMPTIRNYSDPAKAPQSPAKGGLPHVRAVAHTDQLRATRNKTAGNEDVELRVYAYVTDPDAYASLDPTEYPKTMPEDRPIAIQVMGMNLVSAPNVLHSDVQLEMLTGGVARDGTKIPYSSWLPASATPSSTDMYFTAEYYDHTYADGPYTLIKLHNTPLLHGAVNDDHPNTTGVWRGLSKSYYARLYGQEYIPSAPTNPGTGAADLDTNLYVGNYGGPKNTARWKLTISGGAFGSKLFVDSAGKPFNPNTVSSAGVDVRLAFRTRIWSPNVKNPLVPTDPLGPLWTGHMWPPDPLDASLVAAWPGPIEPDNLSETYCWWADSVEDVPWTERFQYTGDPRFVPYVDFHDGDADFGNQYNWFHDNLVYSTSEDARPFWKGLNASKMANVWASSTRQDTPRYFETLRRGLTGAGAIYTTLTGYAYYYVGYGGEIGYDAANGYPNSIPTNLEPWGSPSSTGYVNTITGSRQYVRSTHGSGYWWGIPWLGELYPDTMDVGGTRTNIFETQWSLLDVDGTWTGNLEAGNQSNEFFRQNEYVVYMYSKARTYGTHLVNSDQRPATRGATAMMNFEGVSGTFDHDFADGKTGTLVGAGLDLANNYNFPMPTTAPISRPWHLADGNTGGEHWNQTEYSSNRYLLDLIQTFYDSQVSGRTGSGLLELRDPTGAKSAYIVANGLDRTVESGSSFIAKYSLLSMVQSFFESGGSAVTHRIKQPPRVIIEAPTEITEIKDPASITLQFDVQWFRWDGQKYTTGTPDAFAEDESEIDYVLMYSKDSGATWLHCIDDSPAEPGVKPEAPGLIYTDQAAGSESYAWSTPSSSFPEGSYLVRIEAYRANQALHYSQHQVKIFIQR